MEASNVTEPLKEDAKESGVKVPQQAEKNIKSPLGEEKTSNAKHNYLSGDAKKTLDFLQRVSDILQPSKEQTEKEKQEQWELIAKLESRKNEVFPYQWDEKLTEGRPQMKKILMNPKWRRIYDFQSLQSLLRVVRNLNNHYYEQNREFKTEVGEYPLGLLQSFTSRFPNFVPCIFDVMRDQEDLADFYKPKADQIEEILRVIHENTWRKTQVTIGETFKRDKFPELEFEVYPLMAESPNFFDGGHQETDSNDTGGQQLMTKTQRKPMVKKARYKKDDKFMFLEGDDNWNFGHLSTESLMKKIFEMKDKLGVLGVVAQAGAGKTTCMRRWTRWTMQRSNIDKKNGFSQSEDGRFKLVMYIEMGTIRYSSDTSLEKILFQDILDDDETKVAWKWLKRNQDKAVIFFDGLDQSHWKIEDNPVGQGTTSTIFYDLLTRQLLAGSRIIISSREHTVSSLPEKAWFDDVITLTGFAERDAEKLFNAMTAVEQTSITDNDKSDINPSNWGELVRTSSALLSFISIPIFLIFAAIVYITDGSAPSTVTDLVTKVLRNLRRSTNIQERQTIWSILHQLMGLSHEGMEKGLVVFSEEDLKEWGLEIPDIRDLILMVVKNESLSHHLVEGDNVFFFCHQILQEFLSACYIVEMRLADFKEFVELKLNEDHWSVVRRFVCGLIFTKFPNEEFLNIKDRNEKQQFLRENLIHLLEQLENEDLPLELYAAIYESNDDQVIQAIKNLNLSSLPFSQSAIHLLGSLLATSRGMDSLIMDDYTMQRHLPSLTDYLKDHTVPIKYIDLSPLDSEETIQNFSNFNKFLQHVVADEINLIHWPITEWQKRRFGPNYPNKLNIQRIKRLKLMYCADWSQEYCFIFDNRSRDDSVEVSLLWSDVSPPCKELLGIYNKNDATMKVYLNRPDTLEIVLVLLAADTLELRNVYVETQGTFIPQWLELYCGKLFQFSDRVVGQVDEVSLTLNSWLLGTEFGRMEPIIFLVENLNVKILTIEVARNKADEIPPILRDTLPLLGCELKVRLTGNIENSSQDASALTETDQVSNGNIKIEPKQLRHIPNLPEDEAVCQKVYVNSSDVSSWEEFSAQIRGHQVHELIITIGPEQINQVPASLKDEVRCLTIHVKAPDVSSWEELSAQIRGHQVDKLTVVIGPGQIAQIPASLKDDVSCIEIHVKASDVSSWEELSAQIQQTQGYQIESLTAPLTRQTTIEKFVAFIKLLKHVNRFNLLIYADLIKTFDSWINTESYGLIVHACTHSGTSLHSFYQEKNN